MLDTLKKMHPNKILFLVFILFITSCGKKDEVKAEVYKNKRVINYDGILYTTKRGGLNFFISDRNEREELFNIKNIDSIVFIINKNRYTAKPLVLSAFSRERNNSDFSFYIKKVDNKIFIDSIGTLSTLNIFSEKRDMEVLKEKGEINCKFLEEK